jgi:hypothetical protein
MLEDILGLSLEEQIRRIAGVKSELCLSKSLDILSKFFVFRIPDSNTLVI